ncbi:MAG TPA: PHP domain-containing protein, partial [Gammaproteobacteria bacterium]|nr:PHP domain-containing protein [Gammaproteobacteria bacterium]
MLVDLHCHTTCSDGELTPEEIIKLAKQNNIEILSITDHDNVDAYSQIAELSDDIQLVPGIEFSTQWQKCSVHIVGLNID